MSRRRIRVDQLARVEGEGALTVSVRDGTVDDVRFRIFEPPRFFEAFLRGRKFEEVPDITARICGICPIAYQMSSVHAVEDAFGTKITGPLRDLRRLVYCGEWIESHALHVLMLHAPDFLGYQDVVRMAGDHPGIVRDGLELKKTGNELVILLAGREIHPVNVRVGGFYRVPSRRELHPMVEKLERARDTARRLASWTAGFTFPDFEDDYPFVALRHPDEYPMGEGRLVSSGGLDIDIREYDRHFAEEQVEHSTALHSVMRGDGPYFAGPLARFNLNFDRLSPAAQEAARQAGLTPDCRNPFRSIIVRCVEILWACDEALRIIDRYEEPDRPAVAVEPVAGVGCGCTEAPRGILYHRYRLDENGDVLEARIVPPTSQNQKMMERDLRRVVEQNLDLPDDRLTLLCEQTIRNYDPCISCSTHFLTLRIERT